MDNDNFFGFDTSIPPEDGFEGLEDEEYDALNDETFGPAAVDGDWEEGHEQMATLTEARRIATKQQNYPNSLKHQDDAGLLGNFQNLSLLNYNGQDTHRMDQGSAPINIAGYQSKSHGHHHHHHHHMGSSLLHDLPGSPSNSIWTPSPDFDKLQPVTRQSPSNGMTRSLGQPPGLSNLSGLPHLGLHTIKTVEEIEEEMKLQHNRPHPPGGHLNVLRAEDFEREMARQSVNRPQHQQGMAGPMHHPHQFNLQRQGTFPVGVTNSHNHINRPFSRAFPNQGNLPGSIQHYQQQQQQQPQQFLMNNFPNNNNRKSMVNHHHAHHHAQGHDNYGMYHHNNFHNMQQQQQNHQYNMRSLEGRYPNANMYDQVRNGNPHDRRNFERRSYDQNRGHDQSKNNYDRPQNNSRDDYPNHSGRIRRDSEAEWEEWHRMREEDEYSGLMTPREKAWLKNIQAMQLNSDNPYQDDYYFVMYSVKQQRKREEEVMSIDGLQLLLPDRGKDGGREYEPPRLENSLGKLQVVSVNAPRKIIDLEVVHLDPTHPTTPLQREMRKHRHMLLHIEKLYNVIMDLDDLERKIRHLPDCPTRDVYKTKSRQQAAKLWETCTSPPERLLQLLCIRKGKSLLYRLLMWLDESAYTKLVFTILQNMPMLTKKDTHDQFLTLFWPITDRLIASANDGILLEIADILVPRGCGEAPQKTNLVSALYNKYGVSLILALMVRGEQLAYDFIGCGFWQEYRWQNFLEGIVNALVSLPDPNNKSSSDVNKPPSELPQALPSVALAASPFRPAVHLSRCSGVDPHLLNLSQKKMAQLEATHTKSTTTQSPAKC